MEAQSLSIYGKSTVNRDIVKTIFYWYVYAYHRQTVYHLGEVRSLRWDIYKSGSKPSTLAAKIEESLYTIYRRYYPDDDINIHVGITEEDESRLYIKIDILANISGEEFKLSDTIKADENKIFGNTDIFDNYYKYLNEKET